MNRLEQRYRSALRLLPAGYRRLWEEDMVGAYLDSVHTDDLNEAAYLADYGRPSWAEVGSVAALAFRLRIGGVGAPPRYLAWGAALRLVALLGLLAHAAMATFGAAFSVWLSGAVSWLPAPPEAWAAVPIQTDAWYPVFAVAGLAWIPAFCALLTARWRAAQGLALLAVLGYGVPRAIWGQPYAVSFWAELLLDLLIVLALSAYHRESPMVRQRPWLIALAASTALVAGLPWLALLTRFPAALTLLDWPGLCALAVLVAAVAIPAGRRAPEWPHALALLAGLLFVVRVVTLVEYSRFSSGLERADLLVGGAEAVALLAVCGALSTHAARALHRLPSAPAGSAAWSTPVRELDPK
jgi:hypothetical protein